MLNLKYIQENKEQIIKRLAVKNFKAEDVIKEITVLDDKRKDLQSIMNENQAKMNSLSKQIGQLFKDGKAEEANKIKDETSSIKNNIKLQEEELQKIESAMQDLLVQLPNVPHESVVKGKGEEDNVEVKASGAIPEIENKIPHWDLATKYDIIDFELGNKITGAGFPVFKNQGARLQRALINFFLDEAHKAGYSEIVPPLLVNEDSGFGTGQLPDKEGQMYHIPSENFYLIPTSEIPITNIYRNSMLNASDFPIKLTAYTPCFRREAGSYGKDVRGLNRLHQFDKIEIMQIQHPDKSYQTLDDMVAYVETLVQKLELPYRITRLCGGDLGFTSALTYDFEVFSAGQEKWLEVSSVSNFESFQANRLKLRFKEKGDNKAKMAHTLNGSALALPRIMAALIENNQTPEGITIPKVLTKYTGFGIIK